MSRAILLQILLVFGALGAHPAVSAPAHEYAEVSTARRTRPALRPFLSFPSSHSSLLFVAAHPDDEVLLAPVLGWLCDHSGWSCTILIATRGERGECLLPQGCLPTLADVRSAEAAEAARLFSAKVILWNLADGPANAPDLVRHHWESQDQNLTDRIAAFIEDEQPDVIFTFDPRHGSTCHPDHRAIGSLAMDAAASLSRDVFLLENRYSVSGNEVTITRASVDPSRLVYFDASRSAPRAQSSYWDYGPLIATIYRSQFSPEIVQSLAETPRHLQWMFFEAGSSSSAFAGAGMCENE